ncbi:hypothetical protein KUCAC02_026059, partial [Chaenocephalus aceratus]
SEALKRFDLRQDSNALRLSCIGSLLGNDEGGGEGGQSGETSSAGSPLISLSEQETAQALSQNLSGPGEHNASSITGTSSTGFSFD